MNGSLTPEETTSPPASTLPSLFSKMRRFFKTSASGVPLELNTEPQPVKSAILVDWSNGPFLLTIGKTALEFHPDSPNTEGWGDELREWLVHGGPSFYSKLCGFLRVSLNESLVFGRLDEAQSAIFEYSKSVSQRHIEVTNYNGNLTIKPLDPDRLCTISKLTENGPRDSIHRQRQKNLHRLPKLLAHPIEQLKDADAFNLIEKVNRIMAKEVFRELNGDGNPGGIVMLPDNLTPLIVGDIHARINNLLKVIIEGGFIDSLERKEACLILLGDLVHAQEPGELENMQSSVLILDLFLMLKARFPKNVFYLRGNHESFSPDVGKGGVAQGILFRQHLKKTRGIEYLTEVEKLFEALPFVIQNSKFAACHGAPTRSAVSRDTLININRYPGIQHEIVWNRIRRGNRPAGYTKGSVKRFRRSLGLSKHASMIVGHTPLSDEDTVWLDVNEITGHHVVYSAHVHRMAAMMMIDGFAVPLEYIAEPLLEIASAESESI
jgi:hypothetical protein